MALQRPQDTSGQTLSLGSQKRKSQQMKKKTEQHQQRNQKQKSHKGTMWLGKILGNYNELKRINGEVRLTKAPLPWPVLVQWYIDLDLTTDGTHLFTPVRQAGFKWLWVTCHYGLQSHTAFTWNNIHATCHFLSHTVTHCAFTITHLPFQWRSL